MASKIQSHNFYVAITPYKVEDSSADEFNLLNVRTAYDDRRKYFYVDLHAGWNTGWGGFGCILMGADDPLTGPKHVKVKDAPKNSQKTINEMGANLEQAKDAIAWLFDHREWAKLYLAVGNIARNGYTEDYRKQMEELINSNNKPNKEDENMRLNINNNESANVQNNAQVNNNAAAIEDVNVGEVTVDSIMPVMQPVEEKPAVTVPLDSHGTLVVGGAPKPSENGKVKSEKSAAAQTSSLSHQTSSLPLVRLVVYTTKRGEQAPRIEGFGGENDPRWKRHYDEKVRLAKEKKEADAFNEKLTAKMKGKPKAEREKLRKQWKSVGSDPFNAGHFTDLTTGDKTYHMLMGAKYLDVARELVDAYNGGDEQAIAAAEQAIIDCKNGIVANIEAEKAARNAEREAKKAQGTVTAGYSDQDVADMLRKVMAGGDVPENIKKLLQAA